MMGSYCNTTESRLYINCYPGFFFHFFILYKYIIYYVYSLFL